MLDTADAAPAIRNMEGAWPVWDMRIFVSATAMVTPSSIPRLVIQS